VPEGSGVDPYAVTSEFESDSGTPGGRPGVNVSIRGAKPYDAYENS
jgi:hypothetical protein